MKGYEIKWGIVFWLGLTVLFLNGGLTQALAEKGQANTKGMVKNKKTSEVSTLFVQGKLMSISSDAYVIRNIDEEDFTVIVTKETWVKERPRVGDHVEVEYLESGKALVVIVKHPEP